MYLKPIGQFSPYSGRRQNSWYSLIGERMYIFDFPYSNINLITNKEERKKNPFFDQDWKKAKELIILITHMHEDHIGGISNFSWYLTGINKKARLFIPTKLMMKMVNYLELTGCNTDELLVSRGDYYQDDNLQIFPRQVDHCPGMDCFAYVIYDNNIDGFINDDGSNWICYYSGDNANFMDASMLKTFKDNPEKKYIYHDISFDINNGVHCYKDKIIKTIPKPLRIHITPMHLKGLTDMHQSYKLGMNDEFKEII